MQRETGAPTPDPAPTTEPTSEQVAVSKLVDIRPANQKDRNATAIKKSQDSPAAKPLFEPIIITIPKPDKGKTEAEGDKKPADIETSSNVEKEKSLPTGAIEKTSDPPKEQTPTSTDDENKERRTVIVGNPGKIPQKSTCTITVSQEAISILNNGGSLGVLVRIEGKGELRTIKPISNSPDDLEIKLEPEIAGVRGQAFYVVRSVTQKTGDFTVAFIAPCGRKEMTVNVR